MRWVLEWDKFVEGKTKNIPSKIDHSFLDDGNGMTKLVFKHKIDYMDIPEKAWNYLVNIC